MEWRGSALETMGYGGVDSGEQPPTTGAIEAESGTDQLTSWLGKSRTLLWLYVN